LTFGLKLIILLFNRTQKKYFSRLLKKVPLGLAELLLRLPFGSRSDTRRPKPGTCPEGVGLSIVFYAKKSRGMSRTLKYVAISLPRRKAGRDEGNPAVGGIDGSFSTTC